MQVKLVVLSYFNPTDAATWTHECIREAGITLPCSQTDALQHVVDRERLVYTKLGLQRSISGSWALDALAMYASMKAQGISVNSTSSSTDDIHQLGGDFLLMPDGKVVMAYYSTSSIDRPTVQSIFDFAAGQLPRYSPSV